MTTHSNILALIIPWTEEPGGLRSMGLQRVEYDLMTNNYLVLNTYVKKYMKSMT